MFSPLQDAAKAVATEGFGWLSSLGITGGMAACIVIVSMYLRESRDERAHRAEAEKANREHIESLSEHARAAMDKFADTSLTIHRECQASGERREAELRQLIRDQSKAG